ncbi:hypothetical protein V8E51_014486 [Hyaloscypha variabilis]
MVAEALAVIGAVSGTVSTINTVKGWLIDIVKICQAFGEAGNDIQDLSLDFNLFDSDLRQWKEYWGLEGNVSTIYLQELWQKDTDCIYDQLIRIQARAGRSEGVLLKYFSAPEKKNAFFALGKGKERERSPITSSQSTPNESGGSLGSSSKLENSGQQVTKYLATALKTKDSLSFTQVMTFITDQGPTLRGQLEDLQRQLVVLRGMSLKSYNLLPQHSVKLSGISAEETNPAKTATLLRLILDSRLASSALYGSCQSLIRSIVGAQLDKGASKPLCLELNLVRNEEMLDITTTPAQHCLKLGFFLLIRWPAKRPWPIELIVEGPLSMRPRSEKEPGNIKDFLREACEKALKGQTLPFELPIGHSNKGGFRSSSPQPLDSMISSSQAGQTPQITGIRLQPLQTLLYNLESLFFSPPLEEFPLSERYRLAFKIAECGLMLCGTSWFSRFRIQHVIRSQKAVGMPRRYLLETAMEPGDVQNNDPKTLQPHIFSVGKLLVEIATGHIIQRVVEPEARREYDYKISEVGAMNPDDFIDRNAEEVFDEVKRAMDDKFAKAVEFCLQRFQPGSHWLEVRELSGDKQQKAYHEILMEYYEVVYQPLRGLVQGHDLAGDGPNDMESW